MIVTVMYQIGPGEKFDLGYYEKTHIPLVQSLFGPAGLKGAQVLKGSGAPSGEPTYHIIAMLEFDSVDTFNAAVKAHGEAVFGDIPKFTNAKPTIQFNERIV